MIGPCSMLIVGAYLIFCIRLRLKVQFSKGFEVAELQRCARIFSITFTTNDGQVVKVNMSCQVVS